MMESIPCVFTYQTQKRCDIFYVYYFLCSSVRNVCTLKFTSNLYMYVIHVKLTAFEIVFLKG